MKYYPELENLSAVEVLRHLCIISENIQQYEDYFSDSKCPYPTQVQLLLGNLLAKREINTTQVPNTEVNEDQELNLAAECREIIRSLKGLRDQMTNLSANEKISTYRLMVTQLDKLIDMEHRAEEVADYKNFKVALFNSLERYLTPAQISEFLEDFKDQIKKD